MSMLYDELVRWHDRCESLIDSLPSPEYALAALTLLKAELHDRYEEIGRETPA